MDRSKIFFRHLVMHYFDMNKCAFETHKIHGKKGLLSVFWDQKGVIFFELLDPGETINAEKYCKQLKILKDKSLGKNFPEEKPSCFSSG